MANATSEAQDYERPAAPSGGQFEGIRRVTTLEILLFVVRRKRSIALITMCFTVLSVIVCFVSQVKYTATATLMPPHDTPSLAGALSSQMAGLSGSLSGGVGLSGLVLKDPNLIYVRVLSSRPVLDDLIMRFDLKRAYRAKDMTEARKELLNRSAFSSEKANTIAISVTDIDRVRAMNIANAYTEELRRVSRQIAMTEASRRRQFYEEQLRDEGDNLVKAQDDLRKLQSKGVLDVNSMSRSAFFLADNLRASLSAKQAQLKVLRESSTEANSQVRALEAEISELKAQLSHISQPSKSNEATAFNLGDIPNKGLEFLKAQHQVIYHQSLYDSLLKQYDIAKLDESKDAVQVQVLEPAIIPEHKSKPRRLIIISVGVLSGLFVSLAWSILIGWTEVWMKNPTTSRQVTLLREELLDRRSQRVGH